MSRLSDINEILKRAGISEGYVQRNTRDEKYDIEYNSDYIEFEPEMRFIDEDDVEWIVLAVKNGYVLMLSKEGEYKTFEEDDLNWDITLEKFKPIFDDRFYTKDDYKRATGKDFPEDSEMLTEDDSEDKSFQKLLKKHKENPNIDIRDIAKEISNGDIEEYIGLMKQYFEKFEK